jgi:riboflavin kinase
MLIRGTVVSGRGEGRFFLTRKGYLEQMERVLGFTPLAGTLNIKVTEDYLLQFQTLKTTSGKQVAGFTEHDRTYGSATCYFCRIQNYSHCAVIVPERGDYKDIMEIIAPKNLRELFGLQDGDTLTVYVHVDEATTFS